MEVTRESERLSQQRHHERAGVWSPARPAGSIALTMEDLRRQGQQDYWARK